jgi:hypothetical protein
MNNTEPTKNRVWTYKTHAVLLIVKSGNSLVDDIS